MGRLIDAVNITGDAVDEMAYDGALDALYARYMEDTLPDAESDAIEDYVEKSGAAFRNGDWARAGTRYDDTQKTRNGKGRGIKTGTSKAGTKSTIDPETVAILSGKGPKFSQGSPAPAGKSVTLARAQQIVKKVLDALGIANVVRIEVFRNPVEAGIEAPANLNPSGVVTPDGRVVIFTDNISSDIEVFRTVFHELFHLGLSKTVGQGKYVQQMLKFKLDPLVRQYAARWKASTDGVNRKGTMPTNNYEALAVEEALADIAEDLSVNKVGTREMNGFVRSMVAKLASFAEAVGLTEVAQKLRRMTFTQAEKFVTDTIRGANYSGASAKAKPKFSAPAAKLTQDERGMPVIEGDGVTLQSAAPTLRMEFIPLEGGNLEMMSFQISTPGNPKAGFVDVLFEDGKPVALYDIEVAPSERGKGTATKAVKALLDTSPKGALHISNIVTKAQGFWATLGIPTQPGQTENTAYDGTITQESYLSSPAGQDAARAGRVDAGNQRTNRPDSGPEGASETGVDVEEISMEDAQALGFKFRQSEADLTRQERSEGVPESFSKKWRTTPMGYTIRNMAAGWRGNRWMLGFLTLDQIKDRFVAFKNVTRATDTWLGMGAQATGLMRPATQLHKRWAAVTRKDRAVAKRLDRLLVGATRAQAWVDGTTEPRLDPRNRHLDFKDPEVVKDVAAARALYVGLPQDVQKLYREITAELTSQFRAKQDALLKRVVDAYADALAPVASREELLEMARGGKLARTAALQGMQPGLTMRDRLEFRQFVSAVDTTYIPAKEVPGPYFPLTRRGDYVVVFRSEGFQAAESLLLRERKALDDLLEQQPPTDTAALAEFDAQLAAAKAQVAKARKALGDAKGKEAEYEVKFVDGRAQAEDARAALAKARGVPLSAIEPVRLRREFSERTDSVPPGFLAKLEAQLQKELPDSSRKDVSSAVRQMVIQSMPERSAFRAELRRMNVAGVEPEDAMYSFVTTSHRNAWTISRLDNMTELAQALNKAASSNTPDERLVGAELQKRYGNTLVYDEGNALLDLASNLSYLTHLGFSPGYYIQNMLQPWMVSMPVLAGKYGFGATNKALSDATVEVVKAMRDTIRQDRTRNNWEMPLDLAMFQGEERTLLEHLTSKGRIDITIRADLGVGTGANRSVAGKVLQKAAELSSLPAHQVEVVNRVATALAAFRLAKRRGSSYEAAMAEADKVVVQTHVDYSVENAPRYMNPNSLGGLGRLTFQFRRYQQAMVFLWGKLLVDTIRHGDKDSARALAYLTGSNLAMAGAAGLPLAAPLGLVVSMIAKADDDDQERDWIEHFWAGVRGAAGDTVHDLARKGIPAALGVDMSSRIGSGSILSPIFQMPNAQTGQEWVGGLSAALFGAAGGTVAGWADAVMVSKDNPAMAIEKVLPAGIRGMFQSINREYISGGMTDRRGNVIIGADELGGTDFLARVLNLGESTQVSNMYDQRGAVMSTDQKRTALRSRLMREYNRARLDRDPEGMTAARKEIDEFNARNPKGVKILGANLTSTYRQEQQRRKEMQGGMRVRERNQDLAEFYGAQ